jgi:hypothetical protein
MLRAHETQHTTFRGREKNSDGLPDTAGALDGDDMPTRFTQRLATDRPSDVGPAVTFAATVLAAFMALALATATLPGEAIMPAASVLFFLFAAVTALLAWHSGHTARHRALSYWDVAGALTLFGIFAGTLTEPDQLVRLIETQRAAE